MAEKTHTANGYTYTVDDNGTVTAKGNVSENPASRSGMSGIHPDGYDSKTDDKGHLIAAREGGVAADYNVSAQDRGLNRGAYKTVENAEVNLANKGCTVETEKTAFVSNPGEKPSAYMVNDTITTPDGKAHTVHSSFANLSKEEQEAYNEAVAQMPMDELPNPNAIPENMTTEEYNQIMEETDDKLGSVKDDYDIENSISVQPSNTENTDAVAPSVNFSDNTGVHDNEAEDFGGTTPSIDSSVSFDAEASADSTSSSAVDAGVGTSAEDGADDGSGPDSGGDDGGMDSD